MLWKSHAAHSGYYVFTKSPRQYWHLSFSHLGGRKSITIRAVSLKTDSPFSKKETQKVDALFPLQEPGVSKIKDSCFLLHSYTSGRYKWLDSSLSEKSYHGRSLAITRALAINLQDCNREFTHSEVVGFAKIKISSAFIFPCGQWPCT